MRDTQQATSTNFMPDAMDEVKLKGPSNNNSKNKAYHSLLIKDTPNIKHLPLSLHTYKVSPDTHSFFGNLV